MSSICNFRHFGVWAMLMLASFFVTMKSEAQKNHNERNKLWEQEWFGCLGLLGVNELNVLKVFLLSFIPHEKSEGGKKVEIVADNISVYQH